MNRVELDSAALLAATKRDDAFRTLCVHVLDASIQINSTYVTTHLEANVLQRVVLPKPTAYDSGAWYLKAGPRPFAHILTSRLRFVLEQLEPQVVTLLLEEGNKNRLIAQLRPAEGEPMQWVEFELWMLSSEAGQASPRPFAGWAVD